MLVPLGIAARLALSAISWGSNDTTTWFDFGDSIAHHGLLQIYATDGNYNHPPLPGVWAAVSYRLARAVQPDLKRVPDGAYRFPWFAFVFKLAPIAADAACCWLLWIIVRRRASLTGAAAAAALYAWNPVSIMVSAHHCNTDPIYATLCLAAVYLIQDR